MNATIVNTNTRTVGEARIHSDSRWRGMYLVGGLCLLFFGVVYLTNITIGRLIGPAPADSTQYLQSLANHASLARVEYGLYSLADILFVPAVLGLYLALRHISRFTMLLATALMGVFIVVDLAITEANSLTIVTLTQHAATAASAAQQASYMAAANYALATLTLATFYSWVISSIGVLLISIVMLKGTFGKLIAYLGIVTGIVATVAGFYVFVPALLALTIPSLFAFGLWCVLVGIRLFRIGRQVGTPEAVSATAA